jgi:hypothetical protein
MDSAVERSAQSTIRPKAIMKATTQKKTSLKVAKAVRRINFLKEKIFRVVQISFPIKTSRTRVA